MATANIDLPKLIERFACEDRCRDYLVELRWPKGVRCPRCEERGEDPPTVSRILKRHQFECDSCRYQFSVRVGTVLHDSKLPLWKWFLAVYMMGVSKKGVSANQLKRMIGVSYKTAWYLCHRIRAAMASLVEDPLQGIVEMDETYIGGRSRGRKDWIKNKIAVLGAVERGGNVRLKVVPDRTKKTIHEFVEDHVDADEIHTDDWHSYDGVGDAETAHRVINHSDGAYVVGNVHTNSVEGVWSLLKRSIIGTYHRLSAKHLPAYLDEMEWRYNNRQNCYIFRDTLRALLKSERLGYEKLTER